MRNCRVEVTDVLVIGAGITGLRAALEASGKGRKVLVVAKGPRCSWGIGGFNAPAGKDDSVELYRQDILSSGCQINDKKLVDILASDSMKEVRLMEENGLTFDHTPDGQYDLLRPLGCSVPRLVHNGSRTGQNAEELFLRQLEEKGTEVRSGVSVLELLVEEGTVYGALGIEKNGELVCYQAKAVVMAAGGCGKMYPVSTYPEGIHGDSYGMLLRAGCRMVDMEFMQFEPCCLVEPASLRGRGISTTMLSAGAVLRNAKGETFLENYFADVSAVQKGELSRAIYAESQKHGGAPIRYDLTPLSKAEVDAHCIYSRHLQQEGCDPTVKPLLILPAAHTFLGGAHVDETCATSVKGLYAAGEALGGLHGANRIGGCAGGETFVFGAVAGGNALRYAQGADASQKAPGLAADILAQWGNAEDAAVSADDLERILQETMVKHLYLIRDAQGIAQAVEAAKEAQVQAAMLPRNTGAEILRANKLSNVAVLVHAIAETSAHRKESRGVFFRSDYPQTNAKDYTASFLTRKNGQRMEVSRLERI